MVLAVRPLLDEQDGVLDGSDFLLQLLAEPLEPVLRRRDGSTVLGAGLGLGAWLIPVAGGVVGLGVGLSPAPVAGSGPGLGAGLAPPSSNGVSSRGLTSDTPLLDFSPFVSFLGRLTVPAIIFASIGVNPVMSSSVSNRSPILIAF
jgi:hypothetical protein